MSAVADFAALLNRDYPPVEREHTPLEFHAKSEELKDIQAVVFDVYGTLIDYWHEAFTDAEQKDAFLRSVFEQTADFFKFTPFLEKINPAQAPEDTLFDFYHNLIGLKHEEARKDGKKYPEIQINDIWQVILSILENNGYEKQGYLEDLSRHDASRVIAYYYNFFALYRGFFPEVVSSLEKLRADNITLGILSNAQFYTPLDITHFIRYQSDDELVDIHELFDVDLCFYSFEYGIAKPSPDLYRRLLQGLRERQIAPEQAVFVGNDLELDMISAREAGMKTAFFTGNTHSTFLHGREREFVPDIVFSDYSQLPRKLSFHEG
ncbi:MAG: HAD family hydrolase [Fibrobacterota bacterium]